MNQLRNLFIAALLILGIGYFVWNSKEGSYKGTSKEKLAEVLPELQLDKATKIQIAAPDGTVTLEKKDTKWTVADRGNYPADFEKVGKLARAIDELKALSTEEVGPSQRGRIQLLPPTDTDKEGAGTDVVFFDQSGKELDRLRIGKSAQAPGQSSASPMNFSASDQGGKFVMRVSDEAIFMVSDSLSQAEADPSGWLNKSDFYKVSKPAAISVTSDDEEVNWSISRATENDPWKLGDLGEDEKMSTSAVNVLNNYMSFPSFTDISTDTSLMENARIIKVTTFDGFAYNFQVGAKTDDGKYPMTISVEGNFPTTRTPEEGESDEDRKSRDEEFAAELKSRQEKLQKEAALKGSIFLVNTWTVDNALKKRSEFLESEEDESAGSTDDDGPNAMSFDDLDLPDDGSLPDFLKRPEGMPIPVIPQQNGGKTSDDLINDALEEAVKSSTSGITIPDIKATADKASRKIDQSINETADSLEKAVNEASESLKTQVDKTRQNLEDTANSLKTKAEEANPWKNVESPEGSKDQVSETSETPIDDKEVDADTESSDQAAEEVPEKEDK